MSDYDRTQETDPRYQRREEGTATDTGPDEVEIYDRPEGGMKGDVAGTGIGLGAGLLILLVVAVLVVLLLLFLF